MGKSPGKWIKTVLFGKKSSKSSLSKDAISEKKTSVTPNTPSNDVGGDSMVISSAVPPVANTIGEHTELEKSSSANVTCDTVEDVRNTTDLNAANDDESIKLEQAATKAQAAFRGYLARRAFWALKGIIRLQALVRGHLVRRQAVATLSCMRAIIEFQALVRGRRVRLSGNGCQVLRNYTPEELAGKKRADLLGTSLRSEKLSTNTFGTKLVASSHTTMALSIQYDPVEPNSARSWLDRWSSSRFWDPLPQPKKPIDTKPKRKQPEGTETGRSKRSVRRIPAANLDNNNPSNPSDNEKTKRIGRKVPSQAAESAPEPPNNELEKVKRSLRKISVSATATAAAVAVAAPETATEKTPVGSDLVSTSPNRDVSKQEPDQAFEKVDDLRVETVKQPEPEAPPAAPQDGQLSVEPPSEEPDRRVEEGRRLVEVEISGKENQKTRRKSFPAKQEHPESVVQQNAPALPSYMAATESAKAKLRAQAAARAAEEGAENGFSRRHSLPSSAAAKPSLHSPRAQKPLQANGKGVSKSNKPQISPKDEKVLQVGWRR